jgi:crotonobetainyl-CoA:carnitine CoA-transferase CaiB-like acyl-CoA transferase
MSLTGDPSTPPAKSGISIIDMAGGFAAALGLMVAVFQAQRTGRGSDVDVSLMDTAISMLSYLATFNLNGDYEPPRLPDSAHPTLYPSQVFQTQDSYPVVTVMKEKFWPLLCDALERPDLISEPRFADFDARYRNHDDLIAILKKIFRTRPTHEWIERLIGKVPCAPVNSIEQALHDPQVLARNMIVETENQTFGRMRHVAGAIKIPGHDPHVHTAAPELGADTDTVLRDYLSYSPDQIDRLRAGGAV